MMKLSFSHARLFVLGLFLTGCSEKSEKQEQIAMPVSDTIAAASPDTTKYFRGEKVPVLCYHAIREVKPTDSPEQKAYSVSPDNFALQMKTLAENGYATITPDALKDYLTEKKRLPEKPILITFDDGRKEQFTIGAETLNQHHFKGVFYIMTVALGKKNYMSRDDVKSLSDNGHVIGCHTWDHHKVTGYQSDDWTLQVEKPKKFLEDLTGKPVTSFAYPYGVWNQQATDSLKSRGFTTAFIFYGKQNPNRPLYTLERINGPNISNMEKFMARIEK